MHLTTTQVMTTTTMTTMKMRRMGRMATVAAVAAVLEVELGEWRGGWRLFSDGGVMGAANERGGHEDPVLRSCVV